MLRETGVIAITGIKRIMLLAIAGISILVGLCFFGVLIWQLIGLLPALSYFSKVSAVPTDAWVAAAIKVTIAAICYFFGSYLFKNGVSWGRSVTAPLKHDLHKSAELISVVESTVSAGASEIKRSVDRAIDSTHHK